MQEQCGTASSHEVLPEVAGDCAAVQTMLDADAAPQSASRIWSHQLKANTANNTMSARIRRIEWPVPIRNMLSISPTAAKAANDFMCPEAGASCRGTNTSEFSSIRRLLRHKSVPELLPILLE